MSFLDCRNVNGINRASFADEMHLASSGAAVYSRFLGRELAGPIKITARANLMSDTRQNSR